MASDLSGDTKRQERSLSWTMQSLRALKVKARTDFTDPNTPGLTLRVTPNGVKTWSFLYVRKTDGKKRRVTFGKFGDQKDSVSLSDARERAIALRVDVNARKDPAGAVAELKRAETVGELLDQFLASHPRPDAAWTKECKRIFEKDCKPLIGSVKIPELTRADVRSVINAVKARGATTTVNRTLAAIRRALSWAVSEDLMQSNPALNLATKIEETPKDRALSMDEISTLWKGLDKAPMGDKSRIALKLILVTGQRPGEVCGAAMDEVDLKVATWIIPSKRAKNRQVHLVPLSPMAVELFKAAMSLSEGSEYVFSSRPRAGKELGLTESMEAHALSHAMRGSLKELGLKAKPATPHDLRRTVATHMARLGIPDRIVGRVLNHGTELRRTITSRVYIQHDYADEKRAALEAWANELTKLSTLSTPSAAGLN